MFIDLKEAFDTVDIKSLCEKLGYRGLQNLIACFKSYFCNGKQFSRVGGFDSSIEGINVGVPQGLCLGPLLLLICVNALPLAVQNSKVSMYTDDTKMCHKSSDISLVVINTDLTRVVKG